MINDETVKAARSARDAIADIKIAAEDMKTISAISLWNWIVPRVITLFCPVSTLVRAQISKMEILASMPSISPMNRLELRRSIAMLRQRLDAGDFDFRVKWWRRRREWDRT